MKRLATFSLSSLCIIPKVILSHYFHYFQTTFFVNIPCPKSLRRCPSFDLVQTVQILNSSASLFFEWNVFWQKETRDSQMEDIRWATAPSVSFILDDIVEVFLATYMSKVCSALMSTSKNTNMLTRWSTVLSTSKNPKTAKIQICWQGDPLFRLPQSEKLSFRQPPIPKRTNKVSLKIWWIADSQKIWIDQYWHFDRIAAHHFPAWVS